MSGKKYGKREADQNGSGPTTLKKNSIHRTINDGFNCFMDCTLEVGLPKLCSHTLPHMLTGQRKKRNHFYWNIVF
jgi:hypothetical protein